VLFRLFAFEAVAKFPVLGQVINQNSDRRHNSPFGSEYEMDGDFFGSPVGQNPNKAHCIPHSDAKDAAIMRSALVGNCAALDVAPLN
jgi:hypothetical protein